MINRWVNWGYPVLRQIQLRYPLNYYLGTLRLDYLIPKPLV